MASVKDVADKAGVSVATVYKVFSNHYSTRPAVRQRVLDAAKELGYVQKNNPTAAGNAQTPVIGAVICDSAATNHFYSFILRELIKELDRSGCRLITLYTEKDTISERDAIAVMMERKLDGLIMTPVSKEPIDLVEQLIAAKFPMLQLFQQVYPSLDTVLFDDVLGAKLAVRHLLQCGHERIMLLTRNARHDRQKGYLQAFEEAGLAPDPSMIRVMVYNQSVKEMIKQSIEALEPTAILSVSEGITTCTLQALRELKRSIPQDVSLIAYDDFSWLAAYGISAVSHPFESFGNLAAKLILDRIGGKPVNEGASPHLLVMDPMLIVRDSIRILR